MPFGGRVSIGHLPQWHLYTRFTLVLKQTLNVNWEVESFDVMGHLRNNGFGITMDGDGYKFGYKIRVNVDIVLTP